MEYRKPKNSRMVRRETMWACQVNLYSHNSSNCLLATMSDQGMDRNQDRHGNTVSECDIDLDSLLHWPYPVAEVSAVPLDWPTPSEGRSENRWHPRPIPPPSTTVVHRPPGLELHKNPLAARAPPRNVPPPNARCRELETPINPIRTRPSSASWPAGRSPPNLPQ